MRRYLTREPVPRRGITLGLVLVIGTTAVLAPLRDETSPAVPALLFVLCVVFGGIVGGGTGAVVTALGAGLSYYIAFLPPYGSLHVQLVEDVVALGTFVAVGVLTGRLVAREAERRRVAEQRARELEVLNRRYEALQVERARLEDETVRLAVLEQVDRQRRALLHSVSHDLRTPLAAIQAVASDLRADVGYDDATRHELLDLVVDEAQRLDRFVANLLSLSRVEAGALHPERQAIAVDELVADCVQRLRRLFSTIELTVDIPESFPLADADYAQLDQVVSNLLQNAARYAPAGSAVHVRARARTDRLLELCVDDAGPGIDPEDASRLFEPFWHGPGSSSSGIGLAICKAIVEAHGGTIHAERSPTGGARLAFTVPAHRD